jgi:hypothetical protein
MKLTGIVAPALLCLALSNTATFAQTHSAQAPLVQGVGQLKHHHFVKRHKHGARARGAHVRNHVTGRRMKTQTVAGNIGGHSVRFVHGRLICAINVSNWLRAHGFHSPESRSSKAFLKYARVAASNVRYGDIHFNYRKGGGHVMIALGNGQCLNPSSKRQAWVVKACPVGGTFVRT